MRQQLHSCLQPALYYSNSQWSEALQASLQDSKHACMHCGAEHACVQSVEPESDKRVVEHLISGHLQQAG